ncbi:TPA: hypothetical protein ACS50C_004366 [Salmonella enterica]|uniref:Uncharacterized protein n=2 Tax=Salmonella enterica TaxID=28901 RepID=A0A2I5HL91_SALDZ|nr:hypothetical protein [Salmonella enterica]EBR3877956.1 hypothetical protein [Salmonella enterica subsp. arizonae]EBV2372934.1 hypothetical protein [Salmonella enterica subsp. enterica serovar Enteritidis]EBY1048643.1 hypothetical protein [Salmonella enterica subsp. enterica serovar Bareilly]ECF1386919.1 hypothetical protein [Salmonella enterica subsp. enterica serovar Stanley]ECF2365333.1 hypothetical protein [Salmonella enterica subsp. enterica serovar Mountpleasant]ECU8749833.1 hypotheti
MAVTEDLMTEAVLVDFEPNMVEFGLTVKQSRQAELDDLYAEKWLDDLLVSMKLICYELDDGMQ